jgi:hypothetical protein
MAKSTSLNGVRQEEWETLTHSVNAGFLRRWDLHDPGGPERSGTRTSRMLRQPTQSRQPTPSRRAQQAAVR